SSPRRLTNAPSRPIRRARSRCASGSLPTRIEMKMMLSSPSTISSAESVSRLIQTSGLASAVASITGRNVPHFRSPASGPAVGAALWIAGQGPLAALEVAHQRHQLPLHRLHVGDREGLERGRPDAAPGRLGEPGGAGLELPRA